MSKLERGSNAALVVIAVILSVAALKVAEDVFAPLMLALVIGIVLSPISDLWERLGFPAAFGALTSLVLTLGFILVIAALVQPIGLQVMEAWPMIMNELRSAVRDMQGALSGLQDVGKQVDAALGTGGAAAAPGAAGGLVLPSTTDALFLAPAVAGQTVIFAGVLFFFLLTRNEIYDWIAGRIAPIGAKRDMSQRLRLAERQVSIYFVTIAVVNIAFGLCVMLFMGLLGLPTPYIWGVATMFLNFILYLGPAILILALGVTGIVLFDGFYSFIPALVFLGLNILESQFVTPAAIGRRLSVNPLLIFLALVFFLWLWGPLGGFVAIPLLLWGMVLGNELRVPQGGREVYS